VMHIREKHIVTFAEDEFVKKLFPNGDYAMTQEWRIEDLVFKREDGKIVLVMIESRGK